MNKTLKLFELANELALRTPGFFEIKGPGKGNHSTNSYINELGRLALETFGQDYSEKNICGDNSSAVDFYFPDDATIVEVALGLRNPNTEYEKDILKAIMAKEIGHNVSNLIFISKPGGDKKCMQPGRVSFRDWLDSSQGIKIKVFDLG